ncbi:hypothetical protein B0H11DRAFT_2233485 [Mycena galericulata]|nr:hypothetical protein B0H11DRAFT_2233485 [Mycena galericulata]
MPGGVSLTGLAFLTNPHRVGSSKTWYFDVSMFLGSSGAPSTCGRLRYFNTGDRLNFGPVGVYFVHTWVGQMNDKCDLQLTDKKETEKALAGNIYDFVGDIQWLIPVHEDIIPDPTSDTDDMQVSDSDDPQPEDDKANSEDKVETPTIRMPKIDTEHRPYVTMSGVAINGNKPAATFDMDVDQYTQFAKVLTFPASCWIIDSPRWKDNNSKPVPFQGKYVTVSGYLVGVEDKTVEGSQHKCRFKIEVDNVIYLGSTPSAATPSTPAPPPSSAPKKRPVYDNTPSWVGVKRSHTDSGGPPSSSPSTSRS